MECEWCVGVSVRAYLHEPRVRGTEANWRHGRCSGNIPATEQTVKRSSRVVVKTPGRRN